MDNTNEIKKLLNEEINNLLNKKWHFLNNTYPTIETNKNKKNILNIDNINDIKKELHNKLGYLPIFVILTDIFYKIDLPGPYKHVDKCLLLIYQLTEGKTINEMTKKLSTYHNIYKDFYIKNKTELNNWLDNILYNNYFSKDIIRILSSRLNNNNNLKNITCFIDEYDSRISYKDIHFDKRRLFSCNLNSFGYKTQFIIDSNMFILHVSFPKPSSDYVNGEIIKNVNFKDVLNYSDRILLNDVYLKNIENVIKEDNLKGGFLCDNNFCKIESKDEELYFFNTIMNDFFVNFTTLFKRFDGKNTVHITEPYCYDLQLKLCCVLYNIKRSSEVYKINDNQMFKKWLDEDFEYDYKYNTGDINNYQDDLIYKLISQLNIKESNDNIYEVEKVIDHRIYEEKDEYLVKWKNYDDNENTWVLEEDFIEKECIYDFLNNN